MKPAAKAKQRAPKAPPITTSAAREEKPADALAVTGASDLPGLAASGGVSLTRRIAAISRWRENYNPLRGLSFQRAVYMAESYPRGWMADLQWVYFFIEQTDEDLFALCDRRTSRLLEMDYSAVKKKDADEGLAKEQAAFLEERFDKIDNLYEAIEHLAMASFRGYSHCEKWYNDQGELSHLEVVDQWNCVRDGLKGGWKYNPQALQTSYFALDDALVMPIENFLYRDTRRHINRIALFKFLRQSLANKDWDAFVEIYGIPSGVITGPPNIPTDKAADFEAAAREISEGGSGFLPHGSEYKPNNAPRGTSPFKERLEYLSEKLILAGTGGMLTMLARSGSGTLAGGAHTDVFEQIAKAEARKISELINEQLAVEWLDRQFPGKPHAAYFALSANEETKVGEIVAHITGLAAAGYQVDAEEVSERTGYTVKLRASPADADGEDPIDPAAGGLDGKNSDPESGDPPSVENRRLRIYRRMIRNSVRRQVDAGDAVFTRNAVRKLTKAQTEAVQPMLDRVAAFKELPADQLAGALVKFRTDIPRLHAEARLHAPDIDDVWDQVLGTAMVDGLADMPSKAA
ncbi:MAG TPA: DUF935 family protein [Opitutaceae bacterium]